MSVALCRHIKNSKSVKSYILYVMGALQKLEISAIGAASNLYLPLLWFLVYLVLMLPTAIPSTLEFSGNAHIT